VVGLQANIDNRAQTVLGLFLAAVETYLMEPLREFVGIVVVRI
jgi:hypothetical protein